jgi:hypothetical protein
MSQEAPSKPFSTDTNQQKPRPKRPQTLHSRFTDPIPSFPGKPPTEEERKVLDAMKVFIDRQTKQ